MRIIRIDDQPDVPWKNGGGTTREMLSSASGPAGFDWRISVATITEGGPFSIFPGVDRTLIGLMGEGRLWIGGRIEMVAPGAVLRFAGDDPVSVEIGGGPIRVLNVMTANGWRQDIGSPQPAITIRRRQSDTRIFAVVGAVNDSDLRPGDLILGDDDGEGLGPLPLVEIHLANPSMDLTLHKL